MTPAARAFPVIGQRFVDKDGRVVFVAQGLDESWMTMYWGESGGLHRLKSEYLPVRQTRRQAETDLDLHASLNRWRRAET